MSKSAKTPRAKINPVIPEIKPIDPRFTAFDKPETDPINQQLVKPSFDPVKAAERDEADKDTVTAIISKAFRLTDDGHRETHYDVGIVDMPRSHADHWYAKSMGVTFTE